MTDKYITLYNVHIHNNIILYLHYIMANGAVFPSAPLTTVKIAVDGCKPAESLT